MKQEVRRQLEIIASGTEEILPEGELARKIERSLARKKPLRVKMGFDPSAPDIHLGHAVGLRKLRAFQDLGHLVVIIVGDYTGMVGDPTGRNETRPRLTLEEVQENARTYLDQLFKILDRDRVEVRWNGEWFSRMDFQEVMGLASRVTVARMLERDDFEKRYREGRPISIHEFFYPLMQGYDSVAVAADVELGGTEQKFNLLMGRSLQEGEGMEAQVIITVPILEGLDGVQRMSKSLGNYVGVCDAPREMFGKIMSIPDRLILRYFTLATDALPGELTAVEEQLAAPGTNPRDVKVDLARRIVSIYHSPEESVQAEKEFARVFSGGGIPDEMPSFELEGGKEGLGVIEILGGEGANLVSSKGEARRRIREGAVRVDGEKVRDELRQLLPRPEPYRIQVGKRTWARVVVKATD